MKVIFRPTTADMERLNKLQTVMKIALVDPDNRATTHQVLRFSVSVAHEIMWAMKFEDRRGNQILLEVNPGRLPPEALPITLMLDPHLAGRIDEIAAYFGEKLSLEKPLGRTATIRAALLFASDFIRELNETEYLSENMYRFIQMLRTCTAPGVDAGPRDLMGIPVRITPSRTGNK